MSGIKGPGDGDLEHDDATSVAPYLSTETAARLLDGNQAGGYGLPITPLRSSHGVSDVASATFGRPYHLLAGIGEQAPAGAFAESATKNLPELPASVAAVRDELAGQGAIEDDHAAAAAAKTDKPE